MRRGVFESWRPKGGDWDRAAATHLFRRAGFGPRPGEVERALADGFETTLERVLANTAHDRRLRRGAHALLAAGDVETLQGWWVSLLVDDGAQLTERMCLLWHDHFATSDAKVDDVRLMHRQNEIFRELGLGDFRAMLHALAKDPAMLVWLDGNANKTGSPNENFAREIMELFCLGIGNYTERDVQEAARAFTGWGTAGRSFEYHAENHDAGGKEIFGRRGNFGGEDVVELVLAHEACPRHVAQKLLEELVHPEPTGEEVQSLARFLVSSDWEIGRAVEHVLRSALFFSPRARRSRIAGPVEISVSTVRALGARVAPVRVARTAEEGGQSLFRPPSVKGWDGGPSWIQASSWIARHNALAALAGAHGGGSDEAEVDLRAAFGGPESVGEVPGAVTEHLLPDGVDGGYFDVLERTARAAGGMDEALSLVTALVLTSPEYHLI